MGPTASGKTGLAVELAQRLPVELISVDSALVYRGMDIGTAKPDKDTLACAPHHLIDIIPPTEVYSAAQFRADALRLMAEITMRGRIPLLVGGTMLYFKALQGGLNSLPPANAAIRARLEGEAAEQRWPALHARLAKVDPETAARLEPADAQRIQRALEVHEVTGTPMSRLFNEGDKEQLPYRLLKISLLPSDRAILHQRIAERFNSMLALGLIDELKQLRNDYPSLDLAMPSMRCVGYRQAWQYLQGDFDLMALHEKGIASTRQLAKRQMTWLRGMDDTEALDCHTPNILDSLIKKVERHSVQSK
jgi:tRNA dimethylallyltransferase